MMFPGSPGSEKGTCTGLKDIFPEPQAFQSRQDRQQLKTLGKPRSHPTQKDAASDMSIQIPLKAILLCQERISLVHQALVFGASQSGKTCNPQSVSQNLPAQFLMTYSISRPHSAYILSTPVGIQDCSMQHQQ